MATPRTQHSALATATAVLVAFALGACGAESRVDFSLQVRPLLSNKCFHCHGPDETHRQAELRLDDELDAKAEHSSGVPVVAGDSKSSVLLERIKSDDPDSVMPPPSAHKDLTPEEVALVERWIAEGASWGEHWSFVPPANQPAPEDPSGWGATDADRWVAKGHAEHGLNPAPAADAYTLCRRLSLDIVGLPPTVARVDRFVEEHRKGADAAVAALVDELLASKRFGEHWARVWLDLARYADTKGYEKDRRRDMWPYRDWVIGALNDDMSLEQFTTEQIAGDLLPGATEEQRVATAFHRSTLANDENGTDDEEFRVAAVKDRVDTTVQVWMGLTMGCAKCHTHKYDPISIDDYYRFYALFNQTEDSDRYDDSPTLSLPTYTQQRASMRLERKKKTSDAELAAARQAVLHRREADWTAAKPANATTESGATLTVEDDGSVVASGEVPEKDVYTLEAMLPAGVYRSLRLQVLTQPAGEGASAVGRNPKDPGFVLSELELMTIDESGAESPLRLEGAHADFSQEHFDVGYAIDGIVGTGWAVAWQQRAPHWAIFGLAEPFTSETPVRVRLRLRQEGGSKWVLARVRWSMGERGAECNVPTDDVVAAKLARESKELGEAIAAVNSAIPKVPVMRELGNDGHRASHVMLRGNFLDKGETVEGQFLTGIARAGEEL
ncbi:MAG: DUF1549 domain-containing protein, partial [Lacipirellulaceae bacterium]